MTEPYTRGDALREMAEEAGYTLKPTNGQGPDMDSTGRFPRTDAGNGELLAHLYSEQLRYIHQRKRWYRWRDARWWEEDTGAQVQQLAIAAARRRYLEGVDRDGDEKVNIATWVRRSESAPGVEAALKLAMAMPPLSVDHQASEAWDTHPLLLGVGNGVVDLTSGELRPGEPDDLITLHTNIDYDPDAQAPRWGLFLSQIFEGDPDLVEYVQRLIGYALTGENREQVWVLLYGRGQNGKSVFLTAIREVFGLYGFNTPFATFELKQRSEIPSDLAELRHRRLVTAVETGQATRLNEARLKAFTGEEVITARHLHGRWFQFKPEALLLLCVNDLPTVRDSSLGFWRRPHVIPFNRTFDDDQADKHLSDKLRADYPGILSWVIQGTAKWLQDGLRAPAAVAEATTDFQHEADDLADFRAECCLFGPDRQVSTADLYGAYLRYAEREHIQQRERLSKKRVGVLVKDWAGVQRQRQSGTGQRWLLGVGLEMEV